MKSDITVNIPLPQQNIRSTGDAACTKKSGDSDNKRCRICKKFGIANWYVLCKRNKSTKGYSLDKIIHKVEISATEAARIHGKIEGELLRSGKNWLGNMIRSRTKIPAEGASLKEHSIPFILMRNVPKEIDIITTNASGYRKAKNSVWYLLCERNKKTEWLWTWSYRLSNRYESFRSTCRLSGNSKEQVIRKPIELQKYDKETGKPAPNNSAVKFAGAQYTIYEIKPAPDGRNSDP